MPATCKHSTVREYQDILKNHVYRYLVIIRILLILHAADVKDFLLDKLNDGYATSTVSHI